MVSSHFVLWPFRSWYKKFFRSKVETCLINLFFYPTKERNTLRCWSKETVKQNDHKPNKCIKMKISYAARAKIPVFANYICKFAKRSFAAAFVFALAPYFPLVLASIPGCDGFLCVMEQVTKSRSFVILKFCLRVRGQGIPCACVDCMLKAKKR